MKPPIHVRYTAQQVADILGAHALRNPHVPGGLYSNTLEALLDPHTKQPVAFVVVLAPREGDVYAVKH